MLLKAAKLELFPFRATSKSLNLCYLKMLSESIFKQQEQRV